MFCQSCGKQIGDNEKFCQYCGSPTGISAPVPAQPAAEQQTAPQQASSAVPPVIPIPPPAAPIPNQQQIPVPPYASQQTFSQPYAPQQQNYTQPYAAQPYIPQQQFAGVPKKKSPVVLFVIVGIVVLGLIGGGIYYFFGRNTGGTSKSSVVSKGVNTDDLGNIMNGQYYFDDGTNQYYASFDTNNASHIYKITKGSSTAASIFDGFGWSLVVNNGWLYFSGNKGTKIDGTYNLFRMKTDGTGLENINSGYCYGMNIYNKYLYFVSRPTKDSNESYIYRSDLDGKNQTVVTKGTIYTFIVFETKLYYIDSAGDLYCAKDDGTGAVKISTEAIDDFVIGNGKIVYQSAEGAIKVMGIDGKNLVAVRPAGAKPIGSLNSYKSSILYAEYDKEEVTGTYANNYYLHSVNFDGTGDTLIYQSLSYGIFVNALNNKIFVLDYAKNPTTGAMPAIARTMDLTGKNVKDLFR